MGFEPTDAFTSPVFKTGSFNHSDISPDGAGGGTRTRTVSLPRDFKSPVSTIPPHRQKEKWSWWTDSNPRPADYKSAALPTELHQPIFKEKMVPVVGLEPTPCCQERILNPSRLPFHHTGISKSLLMVRAVGLEPTHRTVQEPKSCASANSTMPA